MKTVYRNLMINKQLLTTFVMLQQTKHENLERMTSSVASFGDRKQPLSCINKVMRENIPKKHRKLSQVLDGMRKF